MEERAVKMVTPSMGKKEEEEEEEAAELREKLQLLRSITHSHALSDASVILDASGYIQELKHKVESLTEEIETAQNLSNDQSSSAMVSVETLEKGFLISVVSERGCRTATLCSVLQVFEELGLNVVEARVSCVERFQLQVIGENEEEDGSVDSRAIKQAVMQAIGSWGESDNEQR